MKKPLVSLPMGALLCCIGLPTLAVPASPARPPSPVEVVASRLEGALDSSAQARRDAEYKDVRMTHCRVRVTGEQEASRSPAVFLYVEQALSMMLDKPYRQRFLKLTPDASGQGVTSTVLEPAEQQRLIGLCTRPEAERVVKATDLGKSDCAVTLRKQGADYVGETRPGGCPSSHQGSTHVTSKVTLREDGMDSWDQGWDAGGQQVWGARKGPYEFRRISIARSKDFIGTASAEQLARWISGQWTTAAQAQRDGRYVGYVDNFCTVRVVGAQPQQEIVLYLDKAPSADTSKPFRQQTVALRDRPDGVVEYRVYNDLKERSRFTGLCDRPAEARTVKPEELGEYRCSLLFRKVGEVYVGATGPEGCPGKFANSAQSTTTIALYEDGLMLASTRAFDAEGRQVWGINGGPFEMRKLRPHP